MKAYERREQTYNAQLTPPWIQVTVITGKRPKYTALSNYGERVASGNTLDELTYSLNRHFSV